jgi:hypothetical protein
MPTRIEEVASKAMGGLKAAKAAVEGLHGVFRKLGFRGVAQGVFGVAIVAVSHDVARGTGRFVGSRCHVDRLDVTGAPLRIDIKIE